MLMQIELKLFPRGQFEGLPVIAVSFDGSTLPEEAALRGALMGKAAEGPGVRGVFLERIPWDNPETERLLLRAMASEEIGSLSLFAVRRVEEKHWPSFRVFWSVDVTDLLTADNNMSIEQRCQALPFLPEIEEIWMEDPPEKQLAGGVLDSLSRGMRTRQGFVYSTGNAHALAVLAVCRSTFLWNARKRCSR